MGSTVDREFFKKFVEAQRLLAVAKAGLDADAALAATLPFLADADCAPRAATGASSAEASPPTSQRANAAAQARSSRGMGVGKASRTVSSAQGRHASSSASMMAQWLAPSSAPEAAPAAADHQQPALAPKLPPWSGDLLCSPCSSPSGLPAPTLFGPGEIDRIASNSPEEFPNGDTVVVVQKASGREKQDFVIGWATDSSGGGGGPKRKRCLGVFQCPHFGHGCAFRLRPLTPRRGKGKYNTGGKVPPPKRKCHAHNALPVLVSCACKMEVLEEASRWVINHHGEHKHAAPPTIKMPVSRVTVLEGMVLSGPEATTGNVSLSVFPCCGVSTALPFDEKTSFRNTHALCRLIVVLPPTFPKRNPILSLQLAVGKKHRPPASQVHSSLVNVSRLAYHRKKILREHGVVTPNTSDSMFELFRQIGESRIDVVRSSSVAPGSQHIVLQLPSMIELLEKGEHPHQTDSIEGFIKCDFFQGAANICMTSTYDPVIDMPTPVCVTFLFQKTAKSYKSHFDCVIPHTPGNTEEEWKDNYPGNTSDFHIGLLNGFKASLEGHLRNKCGRTEPLATDDIQSQYKFCSVHYKRSLLRMSKITKAVPVERSHEFYKMGLSLIDENLSFYQFDVICKQMVREFPGATNWLRWYLGKDRALLTFPACKTMPYDDWVKLSSLKPDTNAQEGLGGNFQRSSTKKKLFITEAIEHAIAFMLEHQQRRAAALEGFSISYKKASKQGAKKAGENKRDHRPPDDAISVLGRGKKKQKKSKQLPASAGPTLMSNTLLTCYASSATQCIMALPRLQDAVLDDPVLPRLLDTDLDGPVIAIKCNNPKTCKCSVCSFGRLINKLQKAEAGEVVDPNAELKNIVKTFGWRLGAQQDTVEFSELMFGQWAKVQGGKTAKLCSFHQLSSFSCGACGRMWQGPPNEKDHCILKGAPSKADVTVQSVINSSFSWVAKLRDFKCNPEDGGCGVVGECAKRAHLSDSLKRPGDSAVLIVQLPLFHPETLAKTNLDVYHPSLTVSLSKSRSDGLSVQGSLFAYTSHVGKNKHSGHYTAVTKDSEGFWWESCDLKKHNRCLGKEPQPADWPDPYMLWYETTVTGKEHEPEEAIAPAGETEVVAPAGETEKESTKHSRSSSSGSSSSGSSSSESSEHEESAAPNEETEKESAKRSRSSSSDSSSSDSSSSDGSSSGSSGNVTVGSSILSVSSESVQAAEHDYRPNRLGLLPPLTQEDIAEADRDRLEHPVINENDPAQQTVAFKVGVKHSTTVKEIMFVKDVLGLRNGSQVSDNVVNGVAMLINEEEFVKKMSNPLYRPSYVFSSHFLKRLFADEGKYNFENVKRWTKRVDVFSCSKLYFPFHTGNNVAGHWAVFEVDHEAKTISFFCSLHGRMDTDIGQAIERWLEDEWKRSKEASKEAKKKGSKKGSKKGNKEEDKKGDKKGDKEGIEEEQDDVYEGGWAFEDSTAVLRNAVQLGMDCALHTLTVPIFRMQGRSDYHLLGPSNTNSAVDVRTAELTAQELRRRFLLSLKRCTFMLKQAPNGGSNSAAQVAQGLAGLQQLAAASRGKGSRQNKAAPGNAQRWKFGWNHCARGEKTSGRAPPCSGCNLEIDRMTQPRVTFMQQRRTVIGNKVRTELTHAHCSAACLVNLKKPRGGAVQSRRGLVAQFVGKKWPKEQMSQNPELEQALAELKEIRRETLNKERKGEEEASE